MAASNQGQMISQTVEDKIKPLYNVQGIATNQMLQYELTIFSDMQADDGLVITAKGLGVERLLLSFIKLYSDPTFLVLVLNTNSEEEEFFIDELRANGIEHLPKIITNEVGTNERVSVYMKGGVLFVTSRILVVDLLTDRLPTHLVTGIIVYRAHKIVESGQEAFILRLYRQKKTRLALSRLLLILQRHLRLGFFKLKKSCEIYLFASYSCGLDFTHLLRIH